MLNKFANMIHTTQTIKQILLAGFKIVFTIKNIMAAAVKLILAISSSFSYNSFFITSLSIR